jgi:two-component system sensor histidine kinase HydH
MPRPRVAPLARWSVAAALALMGAALVVTALTTRASVRDARDTLLRGERMAIEQAVRNDVGEPADAATADDLAHVLAARQADGLRYLAVYAPDGRILASAGTSSPESPRIRIDVRGGRRGGGRHGARLVIEIEPVEAEELDEAANRSLGIGLAAAAVLIVIAAFLFRRVLRREQVERERERDRRLAQLGELSAVLAHEIRNPLASLKGNAQLLAGTLPAGEKPRQKADRVVDEAVRLEALTNDLLEFVRTGELRRQLVDPVAVLRDSAAVVVAAGDAAADQIEVVMEAAFPPWSLDQARMREVLVNLIDNAIAAGPPVRATVAMSDGNLVYEISDHGPGVAPGDSEKIFEPFFTRKTKGTGLGLAVARRIVEQHGGTITAGAAPGGGARFRVALPRG